MDHAFAPLGADVSAAADDFWIWYVAAAILVIVATSITTPRYALGIAVAFVVGAVITEAVAFAQGTANQVAIETQEAGRLGAGGQDPNYLAAGLVPAGAISVGLLGFARTLIVRGVLLGAIALLALGSSQPDHGEGSLRQ